MATAPEDLREASEDLREPARAFALAIANQQSAYHDHKEQVVYTGTTLYLAGASWLIVNPTWKGFAAALVAALAALVGTIGGFFVSWQLDMRREAAVNVAAALNMAARWVVVRPREDELTVQAAPSEAQRQPVWPPALQQEKSLVQSSVENQLRCAERLVYAVLAGSGVLAVVRVLYAGFCG